MLCRDGQLPYSIYQILNAGGCSKDTARTTIREIFRLWKVSWLSNLRCSSRSYKQSSAIWLTNQTCLRLACSRVHSFICQSPVPWMTSPLIRGKPGRLSSGHIRNSTENGNPTDLQNRCLSSQRAKMYRSSEPRHQPPHRFEATSSSCISSGSERSPRWVTTEILP